MWSSQESGRRRTAGAEAKQATRTLLLVCIHIHALMLLRLLTNSGVALTVSSFAVGRAGDVIYRRYKAKHNGENPPPERRLDLQMYAFAITAVGKVMFGWFVLKKLHPAAGLVASALGKCLHILESRRSSY
jgi:hypothetical protein